MKMRYLFILLALITISACKPQQKQPFGRNLEMENKHWVLREMNGKTIALTSDEKEMFIKFNINDNTYGGSGICNSMNGMYTVQDKMINIHAMASTQMACPNMGLESEYFLMLSKATQYELKKIKEGGVIKESLILFSDKIQIAKFEEVNHK